MTIFLNNRSLLDRFRDGEEAVLREVYYFYIKDLENFVANGWFDTKTGARVGRVADFEMQSELIQETFLRAFKLNARTAYDGIRPYKIFLFTVAKNVIIDYLRKRPRDAVSHASVSVDDSEINMDRLQLIDSVSSDAGPENVDWQRCVEETTRYMQSMAELDRRFIDLRFIKELPMLEVARDLGISRGKARFLEKDLARRLRKHLQSVNLSVKFS